MALTSSELELIEAHSVELSSRSNDDELNLRYYQGRQRVEQLGMAIPPAMRQFLVVTNWCRTLVDTINARQQVRSLSLPGEEDFDPTLRAISDASNLDAHVSMFNLDRQIYGRAFMSVGANEDDTDLPLIRAESPREMSAFADVRREKMTSAARLYGADDIATGAKFCTLYLPEGTIWAEKQNGKWREVDRDSHDLGEVPVVMHLNRRLSGSFVGESQMTDIIPLVDAAARSLTNLQFAQEAHGIPRMYMTGVKQGDFVDEHGKPIPMFEAYFDAIHMLSEKDAKIGQLDAADLKNFETALTIYGKEAAAVTGFPARYFGLTTANPPSENTLKGEEAALVRSVEQQNSQVGVTLGWVGGLAIRFATGDWVRGKRVNAHWFDPGTPTVSQRADAVVKLASGERPILSREGAWDELGWSEARKDRERGYFEAEAELLTDPYLRTLSEKAAADVVAEPTRVGD